jgi:UDP-N-acetylmuramate dehydrogenase
LFDARKFLDQLPADLRAGVALSRPLREMTTLRVGGPASLVCPVQTPEQARRFQDICHETSTPSYILGAGSNVLADDTGFPGVVLHVAADGFAAKSDTVTVGAGHSFDLLIARSLDSGLTGLEFASGIPGTLGGALVGNAGCYGHEIGEFVVDALILRRDGTLERTGPEAFGFAYRQTCLRETGDLVLEATLRLNRGNVDAAVRTRAEKIADRRAKHPVDLPSAGSWFRNLPPEALGGRRRPAGHFLELAGAKEMSEGDARVFEGHANMIVNLGHASSAQVRALAGRMHQAVLDRFGLELIEEVRYLDPTQKNG